VLLFEDAVAPFTGSRIGCVGCSSFAVGVVSPFVNDFIKLSNRSSAVDDSGDDVVGGTVGGTGLGRGCVDVAVVTVGVTVVLVVGFVFGTSLVESTFDLL
jgi:hypothetical protein